MRQPSQESNVLVLKTSTSPPFLSRIDIKANTIKGVNVSAMSPVCETFYKTLDADTTSKSYSEGIWVCEEKVAPSRLTFAVRRLCSIIWRVDDLQSVMEFFTNTKGVRVGKLWYEVKMVPSGATLEFAVYVNGKRLGEQSVNTIYE